MYQRKGKISQTKITRCLDTLFRKGWRRGPFQSQKRIFCSEEIMAKEEKAWESAMTDYL